MHCGMLRSRSIDPFGMPRYQGRNRCTDRMFTTGGMRQAKAGGQVQRGQPSPGIAERVLPEERWSATPRDEPCERGTRRGAAPEGRFSGWLTWREPSSSLDQWGVKWSAQHSEEGRKTSVGLRRGCGELPSLWSLLQVLLCAPFTPASHPGTLLMRSPLLRIPCLG